ncbi:sensor histidine kinase [Teichococcus aestuarii]|nr:sensor histidine kinase [Pseudoroseomonas aestuarii]
MLLLLMVASVPVVGIAGANAILSYESELATGRRTATILGDVAAARHGSTVESLRQTLMRLSEDRHVRTASREECGNFLRSLLALHDTRYSNFWVLDATGQPLCTALPYSGSENFSSRTYFREAVERRAFALGNFVRGPVSRRPVIVGAVPLMVDGEVRGVVAAGLLLDYFVHSEESSHERAARRLWLIDRDGAALPLTQAAAAELPSREVLKDITSEPDGSVTLETRAVSGAEFAYASARLETDLHLLVGLPIGEIRRAAHAVLLRRAVELAAFLFGCLVVIVLGADIAIARPLRALAERVRRWRPGAPFGGKALRGEPDEVRALEQAFTDAAAAISAREEELRAALRQRDLLMAEIHHRVKNNLQIVASLLNLQANRLRDPRAKAEFATARDRVQALATLHRHLYTNQTFEVIALRPFLEELGQQLFAALGERPGQRIKLVVEADELEIVTDQAVSLALLITETVTNAIKHGFPDARSGTITISVHAEGEEVTLKVQDDGLGMRLDDEEAGQGIGLTLIRGFAQHLGGEIEIRGAGGTELVLRFALRRREAETEAG